MAVLEKIRVKLGVLITVLIAVALLSFIIDPTTLEATLSSFSSKYDVGKIDGKKVRYNEFQERLDYFNNIYTLSTGSQTVSQEAMDQINEMTWQNLIQEYYVVPQIKAAGIKVGEDELIDLSQGKEISPVLMSDPAFLDATGQFSRERLLEFVHAIPNDASGNLETYWSYIQQVMTDQQYFAKYSSLLAKSNVTTPVELRREVEENNTTANVDFVMVPFGFQQDSTIEVSNKEIERYYNAHKDGYEQTASRDVEFVAYEVTPSDEDILATENEVNGLFEEFSKTTSLKTFLARNSDTPLVNYYYKKGELESQFPEIDEFAFGKNPTILPVFNKDNTFYAVRINDQKVMPDSVFVQHILLAEGNQKLADSLVNVLKHGGNFVELAAAHSMDKNPNAAHPGDIGWMTQTAMIPGMEAVLEMAPGKVAVMNTGYGLHVVRVKERTRPEKKVQLAILSRESVASKDTYQKYYSQANDLVSKCEGKVENFDKISLEENLPVIPANNVLESSKNLSRYGNVREVVRWIYEAKEGEVSPIITVDNNIFFVVAVKKVKEEGYAPVSDVASSIRYHLLSEKRAEKMKAEVAAQIKGLTDLNAVASKLEQTISNKEQVSFGSITTGSTDPALIGAVAGAEANKISGPVAGNMGIYVFKVNSRETGSFYTEDDAKVKASQLQGFQLNNLPRVMLEAAEIKDNRARFF